MFNDETGPTEDHEIVAKFREWVALCDAADHIGKTAGDDDPEWLAMLNSEDRLASEIAAMPAAGPAGLAIKVFFAAWCGDHAGRRYAAIGCLGDSDFDEDLITTPILRGCLRGAIRFVPELAALCPEGMQP